jgi:hypothetical protein
MHRVVPSEKGVAADTPDVRPAAAASVVGADEFEIKLNRESSNQKNSMETKHKLKLIRFIPTLAAILVLSAWSPGIARAQDYLGASNLLRQVEARNASPAEKAKKDASAQLRDDLKSFRESVTNLPSDDAAQRWLDLADRAVKVQQQQAQNYNPSAVQIQPDDLLGALPPPTAWNALAKAIAARPPANRLWMAVADAASHQPPPATDLFTLDASKRAMEKKAEPTSRQQMMQFEMMQQMQGRSENLSPALAVAQTPFVRVAGEMILNNNNNYWSE